MYLQQAEVLEEVVAQVTRAIVGDGIEPDDILVRGADFGYGGPLPVDTTHFYDADLVLKRASTRRRSPPCCVVRVWCRNKQVNTAVLFQRLSGKVSGDA